MPRFAKGSQAAKDYMAKLRAMSGRGGNPLEGYEAREVLRAAAKNISHYRRSKKAGDVVDAGINLGAAQGMADVVALHGGYVGPRSRGKRFASRVNDIRSELHDWNDARKGNPHDLFPLDTRSTGPAFCDKCDAELEEAKLSSRGWVCPECGAPLGEIDPENFVQPGLAQKAYGKRGQNPPLLILGNPGLRKEDRETVLRNFDILVTQDLENFVAEYLRRIGSRSDGEGREDDVIHAVQAYETRRNPPLTVKRRDKSGKWTEWSRRGIKASSTDRLKRAVRYAGPHAETAPIEEELRRRGNPGKRYLPVNIERDPAFKRELAAYRKRHGSDPESVICVETPAGSPKYATVIGKVPEIKYDAPNHSNKGRRVHKFGDEGGPKPFLITSVEKGRKHLQIAGGAFVVGKEWILK